MRRIIPVEGVNRNSDAASVAAVIGEDHGLGPPPEVEGRVAEPGREGVGPLAGEGPDPTREPGLLAVDDGLEVDVAEARVDERPHLGDRDEGRDRRPRR